MNPSLTRPAPSRRAYAASAGLLLILATVYLAEWWMSRHTVDWPSVDLMAWAITVDLVLLAPLLVYCIGVRRLGWSMTTLMPVVIVGLLTAHLLAPAAKDGLLADLKILVVPLEIALLGWIGWKVWTAWRRLRSLPTASNSSEAVLDLRQVVDASTRHVVGSGPAAGVLASELAVLAYAFGNRRQPVVEPGPGRFTVHRTSGLGLLMGGALIATAAEIVPVHFLVHHFIGTTAAWILTLLTVYGGLWVVGHWRATLRRPVTVDDDALTLRLGLLWDLRIPYDAIAAVRRVPATEDRVQGAFYLVPAGRPSHCLELTSPHSAQGPYGLQKNVQRIAFFVDEGSRFDDELQQRRESMEVS